MCDLKATAMTQQGHCANFHHGSGACADMTANVAHQWPTTRSENFTVYPGKWSQSTGVCNSSGKKLRKESMPGQRWCIENNYIEETMKTEWKLKLLVVSNINAIILQQIICMAIRAFLHYNKFIIHAYNESFWKGGFEFNKHYHSSSEQRWQKEFQHYLWSTKSNHRCFVLCFPCTDCSAFCLLEGVASAIGEENWHVLPFIAAWLLCAGGLYFRGSSFQSCSRVAETHGRNRSGTNSLV